MMDLFKQGSDDYTLVLDNGEAVTVQTPDGEYGLRHDPETGHLMLTAPESRFTRGPEPAAMTDR
jgi:hypothetical protein